jgi:Mrr N-terminal domain
MSDLEGLQAYSQKVSVEIDGLERQARPLLEQIKLQKERLEAAKYLISLFETGTNVSTVPTKSSADGHVLSARPRGDRRFTPTNAYWPAILRVLVERGGCGRSEDVIDGVGRRLESTLTAADRGRLASGVVRWRNRIAWQRLNMINEGLLSKSSPRGQWEITNLGREWLQHGTNGEANG